LNDNKDNEKLDEYFGLPKKEENHGRVRPETAKDKEEDQRRVRPQTAK
jgi:hypothetical protein